ncbi:uncharacterized protein ELE39_002357 [Cryptosporidium sp. chipmunk genotype I]|uniref:uncharacterized protein n=1 Tax=Cryptosporidium sp. chipmunk genotype I TaxID=1280935 RepID=UPI00351A6C31|nr:hypothetical protein ELE39_002357 [Cryptosporidium sp. chipmunk genotype I]
MNTEIFENGNKGSEGYVSISLNDDDLAHFCPFLSDNNENILFSLTCNYLSLGQFELARSSILHLSAFNFRKVFELISSMIYYGPPPDWQLSATIPTSAHFVLACIREYESFFRNYNVENYIIRRTELDLLMGQMITDISDARINFEIIKNLRNLYCFVLLINGVEVKVPELKILPKIVGLPSYLSRLPSFSISLNKLFENLSTDLVNDKEKYLSIQIINGMFECFKISRSHFNQIAKILMRDYSNTLKFETNLLEYNLILKNTLSSISTSLNWIVLKGCIIDLIFFKENYEVMSLSSLSKLISKNISILKLENTFENHDLEFKNFYEQNISLNSRFTENKKPEDVISIVVIMFCIVNLFSKYELNEEIFAKFLNDQIEILKSCEDICNICAFESKVISNVNGLFSENPFTQLNNFQSIHHYISNINTTKFIQNGIYNDYIGALVNSSPDPNLIFKIVLKFDNILFNINFGISTYLGVFSLPKYIGNKNKVILHPIVMDDFSIHYKFDENPIFWCEYLRYLNLSMNKFEELPIIFISNLMDKIYKNKRDINLFEVANKIILCFPHLRAICVFLGLKNDPIFNWELLKNLWLPFRFMSENNESFIESEILSCNLDEISRRHAISMFISQKINSNSCSEFRYSSDKNNKAVFEEITLKKSIINYFFDNFNFSKKYTTINWMSLEIFISSLIALPLTIGSDISLLTKERDCIKSYLLQKEVFEIIDGEGSSSFGLNLQNVSIEIGNIQTNYFHDELLYCFFCQIFIYLKKIKINNSFNNSTNKKLFDITQLLYYLFIWSNRLSRDYKIEMLPVINKTFEKTILMIELILFSFPFNVPSMPLPKNLEIFTWWYRFILLTPSRVFNTGRKIISSSKNSECFKNSFEVRWIIREAYENNPWYSNLFSFESFCVLNYYSNCNSDNYSEILLSPSVLLLKLLYIQNYEKSIELIFNSKFCVNVTLIVLDGFIFHTLFEEKALNNNHKINKIYGIIKNMNNERFSNIDSININNESLFSVLEIFFSYVQKKLANFENEIGWIFYSFSKLYLAFLLIDLCICFGNENANNSTENIRRAKDTVEQYKSNLDDKYNLVVHTTLDRLFIFYQSSSTISLTRYIMEMDTLPQQTSQIKTHLNRIHDRKLITTTLTQSLNYLSGFSLIKPQDENLININQILEQILFSDGNNSSYLFSVLYYIKSIISELFSDLDKYKAFPILALTPNEIISYSFFERKLKVGSKRLSRIMKADLISVIIKALNCIHSSTSIFKISDINSHSDMEFLIKQLDPFKGTFALVAHNISQSKNVQYSYFTWNFALENRMNYDLEKKQIILTSLEYRIWKYDIHRQLESKIFNINIDEISGFFSSKYLEHFNYVFKWLSMIVVFFFLNYNDLSIIMKNFEKTIGLFNFLFSIHSISRVNTVEKVVLQLSREIFRNQTLINFNLDNFKRIVKLNTPYNFYKLISEVQIVSDPHFILSIIEITCKNIKHSYSKNKNSNNFRKKFIEENIYIILNIQRLFCISYIKNFKNNNDVWNKWFILIKEWKSTKGIILLLKYSIELKMFNIAKMISRGLLFKVIEYNGDDEYAEKELMKSLFFEYNFLDETRKNNFNNFSLVSSINYILENMEDEHIFLKYNNKLSKTVVPKWIGSFQGIAGFLKSNVDINEKYILIDAYINSQSSLLDVNQINVLKTILTSIKLLKDLGIRNIQVSHLFSPYLIIRLAIMTRNSRLIEVLERDIDIFLKSDDILLNLIEESFGVIENKQALKEKIKNSFIFGQADINMCLQLFPTIENDIEVYLNIEDFSSYNSDIYFSIKLISIIPKKKAISDLLFSISDKMSNQLYKIFKKSISNNSLIRPRFECSNKQLWVAEEGSLKTIPDNLHPFSKFSKAQKNSYYIKNKNLNIYRNKLNLYKENKFNIENEISMENISKSRILLRNLIVLLSWAGNYIGKSEFNKANKSLKYLFEIWQRNPGLAFSLKDLVFLNDSIIRILILSDRIKLLKYLSENNILQSNKKSLEKNYEPANSMICNLVENSITISKINQYYNGKNNNLNLNTLSTSRSRNEMIMEIFCNKWSVNRGKITKIENLNGGTMKIIENLILLKPDVLDLNILIIMLAYFSWEKLQTYAGGQLKRTLHFALESILNSEFFSSIFELYEESFISNIKIRMNAVYTLSDLVSNWKDFSVGIENNSDFFTNSNDNLSLSYTAFFLERITNSIKKNIFLRNAKTIGTIKSIQVKKLNSILIYYKQKSINKKKFFQFDFINCLLMQNIPNHYFLINTFVKLNLWWEVMVYILRWSFELGPSKSRSLITEKKRESQTNNEKTFEELFFDLVIKKAHSKNQLNSLINAMNEAVTLGGPRAAIVVKKCKYAIQKYLECNGALEMLYTSFLSLSVSIEIPHAAMGAIAIHLSLLDHLNIDSRAGYLESALYHFKNANLILKKKNKSGIKKNKQVSPTNYNYERTAETQLLPQSLMNIGKLSDVLIPFIADIPIYKINISPWGGLSLQTIQKIIKLLELQNSIFKHLIRESACISILSPNYKDRRDAIVILFLVREYPLAFKASNVLEIPLMEVLVQTTRELIVSCPKSSSLYCFLDSMKLWLSEYDSDALISNAINMWISEKKINLNHIPEFEKNSVMELINKLSNPLSRSEAFNMINPLKKVGTD